MPGEATARDPRDIVTPDAFQVAPDLLGVPLAKPARRAGAMLVDLAVVGLLSLSGSLAFALAIGVLCYQLVRGAVRSSAQRSHVVALVIAVALGTGVFWLGQQIGDDEDEPDHTEVIADVAEVMEAAEENPELLALEKSIELLQKENARLREEQAPGLLAWGEGVLDDIGFGFGWAAAYFTLLTALWNGQTLGKRVFGLRVLRLNGKPLSVWNSFERAGGYAAGFATGLLGFAQVQWDANRQAIHDKICGTVVIDARRTASTADEGSQSSTT
jgi:uncharacterized RDD family membrane protein YckC